MTFDLKINKPQNFVRVSFSNRGLSRVIKSKRSLKEESLDKDTIVNIAEIFRDVRVKKEPPLETKSIPELLGIEYIGYIIDKERYSKDTGEWLRIDEYRILGSESTNFKDSRVAYGETYRYRIKSIIKATLSIVKESTENLESIEDIKRFEKQRIIKQLKSRESVIASIDRITNRGLSAKKATGKKVTKFDLIKGLSIEATGKKTRLRK